MNPILLDGKQLSQSIQANIKQVIQQMLTAGQRAPKLAVVLIGDNPASAIYVRNKQIACQKVGIQSILIQKPQSYSEQALLNVVDHLNQDSEVDGILVQLPLPKSIPVKSILSALDPYKDVDGFHPQNMGLLAQGHPHFISCTAYGVLKLVESLAVALKGLYAVVVGASNIVGKPIALTLLHAGCTVTLCHIETRDLQSHIQQADLLVVGIGQPNVVKSSWIKKGAIVVDVGINRHLNGTVTGDLDFKAVAVRARAITPVPGGVGPMTVTMLLQNTLQAYQERIGKVDLPQKKYCH
jgi:methylenetetrahydrofolate dehydrogenase (NADP+) / methenyltetrahydrofolate cyclohydrolase